MKLSRLISTILVFCLSLSLAANAKTASTDSERIIKAKNEISDLETRLILYRVEQGVEVVGIVVSAAVAAYFGHAVFKGLTNRYGSVDAKPILAAMGVATVGGAGTAAGLGYRVHYIQANEIPQLRANIKTLQAELDQALKLAQVIEE